MAKAAAPETPEWVYDFSDIAADLSYLSSGSVEWDLAYVLEGLKGVLAELTGTGPVVLSPEDPMADIRVVAAYVAALFDSLRNLGFTCPDVDYWADPVHFIHTTTAFLMRVQPYVVDAEPVTIH